MTPLKVLFSKLAVSRHLGGIVRDFARFSPLQHRRERANSQPSGRDDPKDVLADLLGEDLPLDDSEKVARMITERLADAGFVIYFAGRTPAQAAKDAPMKRPQWLFKWIDDLNVRQLAIIAQVAGLIVTIVWVWLLIAAAVLAMLPASLGRILVLPGIWALPGLIVGRRRR